MKYGLVLGAFQTELMRENSVRMQGVRKTVFTLAQSMKGDRVRTINISTQDFFGSALCLIGSSIDKSL